jgi:hypothetical protein
VRRPGPRFSWNRTLSVSPLLAAFGAIAAGCYSPGDGISPPLDRIYFPVGLALTTKSQYLVVVNSDFDLQYNAGSLGVLAVDQFAPLVPVPCRTDSDCSASTTASSLGRTRCDNETGGEEIASFFCVDPAAPVPCGLLGERPLADRLLQPGRCLAFEPDHPPSGGSFYSDRVQIGAFATDVVYRAQPLASGQKIDEPRPGRLFVPVRGDATLHWLDIDESGRVECGQANGSGACDEVHRAGDQPDQENTRDLRLSPEPYGLDVSAEGDAVLVSNQTSGQVSLFENRWGPPAPDAESSNRLGVSLKFVVGNLPSRPIAIAALPTPALARVRRFPESQARQTAFPPGFLLTYRNSPEVDLLRYFSDTTSNPVRPYVTRPSVAPITLNSSGADSRGLAVDGSARHAAELECLAAVGQGEHCLAQTTCTAGNCVSNCLAALTPEQESSLTACLNNVSPTPLDVYIASRSPSSLLVGSTSPALNALETTDVPAFYDSVPLSTGPSRVVTGNVLTGSGKERRVFVSCFDSRRVYVYDPARRAVDVEVVTGRGPYAIAVDDEHHWLFVAHFTDSYIGVVSLDRRFPETYGKMLASIGEPSAPRASK